MFQEVPPIVAKSKKCSTDSIFGPRNQHQNLQHSRQNSVNAEHALLALKAQVLKAMFFQHRCQQNIAFIAGAKMQNGQSGIFFLHALQTNQHQPEKIAPTGWHGRHVFATLPSTSIIILKGSPPYTHPPLLPQKHDT